MRRPAPRPADGFTLTEVLIVVILIGILSAIAIPIYNGQTAKGYLAAAKTDGSAWLSEIAALTTGYTAFGTSGTTTITLGTPTNGQATLTVNAGTGYQPTTQPATQTTVVNLSANTAWVSGSVVPGGTGYCFVLTNKGQTAAFNQSGYQDGKTTCTNGVLS